MEKERRKMKGGFDKYGKKKRMLERNERGKILESDGKGFWSGKERLIEKEIGNIIVEWIGGKWNKKKWKR